MTKGPERSPSSNELPSREGQTKFTWPLMARLLKAVDSEPDLANIVAGLLTEDEWEQYANAIIEKSELPK